MKLQQQFYATSVYFLWTDKKSWGLDVLMAVQGQLRENQFQRISSCASRCRSQYHLYCQRKSPMQRFHCLSESCPLFILLTVPIMNWGRGWRRAQRTNVLSACVCGARMLEWVYLHAYICTFVCRTESDCVSSFIFHITLRKNYVYLLVITNMNAMYLITYTLRFLLCLL